MVKSLTAIAVAAALLFGLVLFEWFYVDAQFTDFSQEVNSLYQKTAEEKANAEDARIVQTRWEAHRDGLHVWIPHNDIARLDDYLSEALRLIGEKEYTLALAKLEIVLHLCETIPDTYKPAVENIF